VRVAKRGRVHVPWLELARKPEKYLDADTIPEGFKVLDPSKLTKVMVSDLWSHWSGRAKAKLPILIFITAREQDLGTRARYPMQTPLVRKAHVAYLDIGSDDSASDDGADKGEGAPGSPIRSPPPIPEEESPAANDSNRSQFLYSLSLQVDPAYKALLNGMLTLPVFVSPFFSAFVWIILITLIREASPQSSSSTAKSKLSLPVWASWNWAQKYLPLEIHTKWSELDVALDLLRKYKFADQNEGTSVVLGFGLLLHECWRVIELEEDDDSSPEFLHQSVLGMKRAREIIKAIEEVSGMLPLIDTVEEAPKATGSDGSSKGQKARAGQRKPASRSSPVRNIRSQRQRKPSKKLCDSD
jgi:hypothetical protein